MIQARDKNRLNPMVLIILDGFGESNTISYNAIKEADTPLLDKLFHSCPYTLLEASGNL